MSLFGPTQDQYDALARRVKHLEERLAAKAENQMGVGERNRSSLYFHGLAPEYPHYIALSDAIKRLAAHMGVEFSVSEAKPAVVTLEKPKEPEGVWFTGTVTTPKAAKKRKAK